MVTALVTNRRYALSRTERLLELLIRLRKQRRFSVQELADELGVSRRTMLRDLQALSAMGVPLASSPGPGGGYSLLPLPGLLPLSLTAEEAMGVILSYEAFLEYAETPFAAQSLSAVTKLRSLLSPDIVRELDRWRTHLAVLEERRSYEAPLLAELWHASLERVHLRAVYESRSSLSERLIFPFGVYASHGYWYCACYDYSRHMNLSLRADRFQCVELAPGLERPEHIDVADWMRVTRSGAKDVLEVRATVTEVGMKRFDALLTSLFGPVSKRDGDRWLIEAAVPESELDYYARSLLQLGTDLLVETPPELVTAIVRQAREVQLQYEQVGEAVFR